MKFEIINKDEKNESKEIQMKVWLEVTRNEELRLIGEVKDLNQILFTISSRGETYQPFSSSLFGLTQK